MNSAPLGRDMSLVEIHDQKTWDAFILNQPWVSFTQSWDWGEFQKTQGHLVKRFFFYQNKSEELLAAAQFIYYKKRFSGYWFAPRGPIFSVKAKADLRTTFRAFLEAIGGYAWPEKAFFFRMEPLVELKDSEGMTPVALRRNHALSPAATSVIDLRKDESILLAAMHPKTRYNIRVAERHGVTIRTTRTERDVERFIDLLKETGERDAFRPHESAYIREMFSYLAEKNLSRLRVAEFEGQMIAANMEVLCGNMVTYLHGASSSTSRNVMAPFLLHWDAIKAAKRDGFALYDLYGCNPEAKSSYYYKPSWEGITRFKLGWGGRLVTFMGTWDLPMYPFLYRLAFPKNAFRG
ncbi:MAG TPA: peptidoglycan bridge formation glycyltransferase FemA/FemB family protein [Patescibacteria group bacterium]|nr:peptidoglycan bridge formation glycyltransferase FemA/FemB family protein [Patescibacteria group bacterium]